MTASIKFPNAFVIKMNVFFFVGFITICAWLLLLRPSDAAVKRHCAAFSRRRCSPPSCCHHKLQETQRMKKRTWIKDHGNGTRKASPSFMDEMGDGMHIGTVNMENEDLSGWNGKHRVTPIVFPTVPSTFEWRDIFPEWIDEEEEGDGPSCPEIPMPDFKIYTPMDLVIANVPCRYPEEGWGRQVERLQIHLVTAAMAAERGEEDGDGRTKVAIFSRCRPMVELFRCADLVEVGSGWWFFTPLKWRLKQKLSLPVGSCQLALPLWLRGIDKRNNIFEEKEVTLRRGREAYATVLHSSGEYVCGAITLAQSLVRTGTTRDLIILIDKSIGAEETAALAAAGWKIRRIERIRNPKANKNSYNEYNYSKFRLWQLTDYTKVVFVDADIIVLRTLDLLFRFPEMSAVGNDGSVFNSGVMVIEPSACTYRLLISLRHDVLSPNGGDQGFLNEVFVWWHRLPRRVNLLKNIWSNSSVELGLKNQLFGSNPSKVFAIHYLGLKPWLCYRDYDCNWDVPEQRVYANDIAHSAWWRVHDAMDGTLQQHCDLTHGQNMHLVASRVRAALLDLPGGRWNLNVTDPRRLV